MLKESERKYLKPAPEPPAIRNAMAKAADREERNLPVYDFSSGNIGRLLMKYQLFGKFSMEVEDVPEEFRPIAQAIIKGIEEGVIESPLALAYSPTGGNRTATTDCSQLF